MPKWKHTGTVAFLVLPLLATLMLGCQPQQQQAPSPEDQAKVTALETKVAALEQKLAAVEGQLNAVKAVADKAAAAPVPAPVVKKEEAKPEGGKNEQPKPEPKQPADVKVAGLPAAPSGLNGCPSKGPDNARVTMIEFTDFQ